MFGLFKKRTTRSQEEEKLRNAKEMGQRFAEAQIEKSVQALKFVYDAQVEVTNSELSEFDFSSNPQLDNNLNLTRMVFQLGYFAAGGQVLLSNTFEQVMGEKPSDTAQLAIVAAHKALREFPIANEAMLAAVDGDRDALIGLTEAASQIDDHKHAFGTGAALGQAIAHGFLTDERPEFGPAVEFGVVQKTFELKTTEGEHPRTVI